MNSFFQCEEEEAFDLLKHLMFRRQMRANYLPDMKQFQLQLYQLSRLIRDRLPELYKWLDANEVSPTLYAAPWILTIFSSQFQLGFVTRIFGKHIHFILIFELQNFTSFHFYRFAILGIIRSGIPSCGKIVRNSSR